MHGRLDIERVEVDTPGAIVYRLEGALAFGTESNHLLDQIKGDSEAGRSNWILNLTEVDRIDSGGIGILCAAYTSIRNAGGRLAIVGLSDRYLALFRAVRLLDVFEFAATEEESLQRLASGT